LAEKYYGTIPANPDLKGRVRTKEPPHHAGRQVEMADPRVRQVSFYRSYLAPSYSQAKETGDVSKVLALEVLAEIIGSGPTSRLSKALVFDAKIAVSARASYSPNSLGPTKFTIWGSPLRGVPVGDMATELFKQIQLIVEKGVTDKEVADARKRLVSEAVFARDGFSTGARVLGAALMVGQTIEDVETWPERIATVTAKDVNAAAKEVFRESHSVTALLRPTDKQGAGQ